MSWENQGLQIFPGRHASHSLNSRLGRESITMFISWDNQSCKYFQAQVQACSNIFKLKDWSWLWCHPLLETIGVSKHRSNIPHTCLITTHFMWFMSWDSQVCNVQIKKYTKIFCSRSRKLIISCKYFQAHIQHAIIIWKGHENIMIPIIPWEKEGFYAQLQHFLSTVWNAHGVPREPTHFSYLEKTEAAQTQYLPYLLKTTLGRLVWFMYLKFRAAKYRSKTIRNVLYQVKETDYILRKSGTANLFRLKHHSKLFF
jgi:hypothetical protein